MTIIKNGLSDKPSAALWLLLMLRLKDATTDQRLEVRHSMILAGPLSNFADMLRCFAYTVPDFR